MAHSHEEDAVPAKTGKGAMKRSAPSDSRLAKLFRLGVGAVSMTEKGLRKAVFDMRLPKEATQFVVEQLERRKSEIMDVVRNEIQRVIGRIDVTTLARELLKDFEVEVKGTIRLVPKK